MSAFEADVRVSIDHVSGPECPVKNVLMWLLCEDFDMGGRHPMFAVCPACEDPDQCECGFGREMSLYSVSLGTADVAEEGARTT